MNVSLTPELEAYVQSRVKSGQYTSASEVVREALRLHISHDPFANLDPVEVRKAIQEGVEDVKAGRVHEWNPEELKIRVRERARQMMREDNAQE